MSTIEINPFGAGNDVIDIPHGGTGQTTAAAAFNALSPMTAAGDIIYGGTSGAGTRLPAGTANKVLHGGTVPSWSTVVDADASLSVKPACTVVATTNQTLSGTPTIDGVATASGSLILLTAQSTGSQNGPWVAAAGAWARPTWYPSGGTTQAFQFITTLIRLGTTYQGSTWRQTAAAPITIDTTSTTWAVTPLAVNSTTTTGLTNTMLAAVGATIDGGGSVILTGSKGFIQVPYAATISGWTVLADQSGSIVIDVKRATYSAFPSTTSIIGGGNKPTLSSVQKNTAAPSGWTSTALAAGDVLEWNVDSATTVTRVQVQLSVTKT